MELRIFPLFFRNIFLSMDPAFMPILTAVLCFFAVSITFAVLS